MRSCPTVGGCDLTSPGASAVTPQVVGDGGPPAAIHPRGPTGSSAQSGVSVRGMLCRETFESLGHLLTSHIPPSSFATFILGELLLGAWAPVWVPHLSCHEPRGPPLLHTLTWYTCVSVGPAVPWSPCPPAYPAPVSFSASLHMFSPSLTSPPPALSLSPHLHLRRGHIFLSPWIC